MNWKTFALAYGPLTLGIAVVGGLALTTLAPKIGKQMALATTAPACDGEGVVPTVIDIAKQHPPREVTSALATIHLLSRAQATTDKSEQTKCDADFEIAWKQAFANYGVDPGPRANPPFSHDVCVRFAEYMTPSGDPTEVDAQKNLCETFTQAVEDERTRCIQAADQRSNEQADAEAKALEDGVVYALDAIRLRSTNEQTSAVTCAAALQVTLPEGRGAFERQIEYQVEFATNGKLYVQVYGLP